MNQVISGSHRLIAAGAVAALIGIAALLSLSPTPASATFHTCAAGEFCLYFNDDANGGYYHFDGSDRNLNNDHYEGGDLGEIVGNTSRYVTNAGVPDVRDDVVIYTKTSGGGAADCIKRGASGILPKNWWNTIESYKWVTDAECKAAGPPGGLILDR